MLCLNLGLRGFFSVEFLSWRLLLIFGIVYHHFIPLPLYFAFAQSKTLFLGFLNIFFFGFDSSFQKIVSLEYFSFTTELCNIRALFVSEIHFVVSVEPLLSSTSFASAGNDSFWHSSISCSLQVSSVA